MTEFLFHGDLAELDPDVADLIRHETARQARYLILIPSESTVPAAVREALGSAFHNIYAEGYPLEEYRQLSERELLDYNTRLPEYRRQADNRYYKGTEYANIAESLARRRAAELFATDQYGPDDLFVNVQPLSGGPANNAVYTALLNVGDTVMGMDLIQGGHLTHGSPVNRSGINYNIISYGTDPITEKIDYAAVMALAQQHQPKMIIAGYSSYPFAPDFHKFREIADAVGAYLVADIAHVAGLAIAGEYPNPVGIADVVTFTTHKTLHGPRGAVIITHRKDLQRLLDRAVFPGEQGGPHVNAIVALAVALRLARTEQFNALQQQMVRNAARLADRLVENGLRVPHGGTNTHLLLVDCKSIVGPDGTPLSGDMAARILDLAGVVLNRQTIPGDTSALRPSGIRIGTPWITQRGFGDAEIDELAEIIADLLTACVPFSYSGRVRPQARAKVDFDVLQTARLRVKALADRIGIDTDAVADDYPHFHYMETEDKTSGWQTLAISGDVAADFLQVALTSNVYALQPGDQQPAYVWGTTGPALTRAIVEATPNSFKLHTEGNHQRVTAWLRSLSDGLTIFDPADVYAKVPGPVDVQQLGAADTNHFTVDIEADWSGTTGYAEKAYFIGINNPDYDGPQPTTELPEFNWTEPERDDLLRTPLYDLHQSLGAKTVEFAGYDMPVWYTSVKEEHQAVRQHVGIFDVTHMGVFDLEGPGAAAFLDIVTTNDVTKLAVGESQYTYLLDINGLPLDDLMIYRLAAEHYLVVVNASNNDKNWAWLNAVKDGAVRISATHPGLRIENREQFILRDLRDPANGSDQRLDIALQGPASQNILLQLGGSPEDQQRIKQLKWADVVQVNLSGYDLIVSRTGYTGERVAYELFIHPDQAANLFQALIDLGAVPCGLAARDSLRIEAGLPLYGHELAGPLDLNPADAGFSNYVRLYKPFFIGKAAYVTHEIQRDAEVVRFRLDNLRVRPPHQGDPIIDERGRVIGIVTSCSVDSDGYQLGQAYIKQDFARSGTALAVFVGSASARPGKALNEVSLGDRIPVPEPATVLRRFPQRG